MSARQSRLAQAIRAIVLGVIKDKGDDDLISKADRDRILGRRGIGYMFPDGLNAGGISGTSGVTLLGTSLSNLSQFATNEQIEKIKKTEENRTKSITEVLNMNIGGKAMAIDGLIDCATGKEIEINNLAQFKPPPGWIDANTPEHEYQRFTPGTKWVGSSASSPEASTAEVAAKAARDADGGGAYSVTANVTFDNTFPHTGGNVRWIFQFKNPALPTSDLGLSYYAYDVACTPGSSASCPTAATIPWPADNKLQLARQPNGQFKVSPNEAAADIIPAYTDNQHSRLDLCFSDGSGRKATIESTYDGGWMVYETLDGEAVGKGTRFDTTNTAVEIFNAADEAYAYR